MDRKRLFLKLISAILFIFLLSGCNRAIPTGIDLGTVDTSQDPLQTPCPSREPVVSEIKKGRLIITPVAGYRLAGVVVSKKSYSDGWGGKISSFDLAIAWGKLAEPEYRRSIRFSQSYRWYHYRWDEKSPFDASYVIAHSANNHVIPANENIRRALKTIKKKDRVVLEGYLVNLQGTYKGREVAWNTSLSRTDTGSGSCELFYVFKVRIETRVYE